MTHDHGDLYGDWNKMDRAIDRVHAEIAHDQVLHPLSEYAPGSAHLERLYRDMERAQKWTWPPHFVLNV